MTGPAHDDAMVAADAAHAADAATSRDDRAGFRDAIAAEIEARVDAITEVTMAETGLPEPRIRSVELPRMANQLRLFAPCPRRRRSRPTT